ncbi:MAG: hypothetical protein JWP89_2513 [Schlesneria sp.]|nr:hypothetical protein [Schlesneria sp.]
MLSRPVMGMLIAGIMYTHSGCIRSDENQPLASEQFPHNRNGDTFESAETDAVEATIDLSAIQLGQRWKFETWLPPFRGDCVGLPLEGKWIWTGRVVAVNRSTIQLADVTPAFAGFGEFRAVKKSSIQAITRVDPPTAPTQQVSAK